MITRLLLESWNFIVMQLIHRSELCRLEKIQITGIKMPEEKSFSTEIPHHSHSCLEIFAPDEIMIMMIYDAQYVMGRFFRLCFFFLARKIAYLVCARK